MLKISVTSFPLDCMIVTILWYQTMLYTQLRKSNCKLNRGIIKKLTNCLPPLENIDFIDEGDDYNDPESTEQPGDSDKRNSSNTELDFEYTQDVD